MKPIEIHESTPRQTLASIAAEIDTEPDLMNQLGLVRIVERAAEMVRKVIVQEARDEGITWQEIGDALGVTKQAAQQRYGNQNKDYAPSDRC